MEPHPVRLTVEDDLRRSRLTVFFRILLAIPHLIWLVLWSIGAIIVGIINWFATLFTGRPPEAFHKFLCAYVRYTVHLGAYLGLVANPYPGFTGGRGEYNVDLQLPDTPQEQARWKTFFRIILVIPAAILAAFLGGGFSGGASFFVGGSRRGGRTYTGGGGGGGGLLTGVCAIFGWFASLVLGRMPRGLRDAGAYGLGYGAQVRAYLFLITDRYPNADPTALLESVTPPPAHPVHLVVEAHDLRRSRVTVFFRLPLTIPHIVWLYLWSIAAELLAIINWFATLIMGRSPRVFHRFFSAYVRYQLHVYAFATVAANPFPGFLGAPGSYPLDLATPEEPQSQSRAVTFFRIILAIPAWIISAVLLYATLVASIFTWFVALIRGSAPWGLRNLMAYALRYGAQVNAYVFLVTDQYPHASPLEGEDEPREPEPELSPA